MLKIMSVMSVLICLVFVGSAAAIEWGSPRLLRRFVSLQQIRKGMTEKEVAAALHNKVITGYEMRRFQTGQYKPITINNPYRSETFKKKFKIHYYLIGIKKADGQVTDDELIPIVFQNNKMIGQGWGFLNKNIKKK